MKKRRYFNPDISTTRYVYPREYTSTLENNEYRIVEQKGEKISLYLNGVPDGVSPRASIAMYNSDSLKRLYIFSNNILNDETLAIVEKDYKREYYPMFSLRTPCGYLQSNDIMTFNENFFMANVNEQWNESVEAACNLREDMELVEYRYFHKRFVPVQYFIDRYKRGIYRFSPSSSKTTLKVIIMPQNFYKISEKSGYFIFQPYDLIVYVFSKCFLSASNESNNIMTKKNLLVNDINLYDSKMYNNLRKVLSQLGIHSEYTNSNDTQMIGYDDFESVVIGDISNVNI